MKHKGDRDSIVSRIKAFLEDHAGQLGLPDLILEDFIEARYKVSEVWRAYHAERLLVNFDSSSSSD